MKAYYLYTFKNNKEIHDILDLIPLEYFEGISNDISKKDTLECVLQNFDNDFQLYLIENHYESVKYLLSEPDFFCFVKDKTYDMCLEAVIKDSSAIYYVPEEFKDEKLCLESSKKNQLIYIPDNILTEEMVKEFLKRDKILKNIPKRFRTEEINILAIEYNPNNIDEIENPSRDLIMLSVSIYGNSIHRIPIDMITDEIFKKAFECKRFIFKKKFPYPENILIYYIEKYLKNDNEFINFVSNNFDIFNHNEWINKNDLTNIEKNKIKHFKKSLFKYDNVVIKLIETYNNIVKVFDYIPDTVYDYIYNHKNRNYMLIRISPYSLSEENILRTLDIIPYYIFTINNPTEKMINLMFTKDLMYSIGFIEYDNDILEEIIRKHPMLINSIKNPSTSLKKLAITIDIKSFKYIKNQDKELCKLAVTLNSREIMNCYNEVDEEIREIAYLDDLDNIQYFFNDDNISNEIIDKYLKLAKENINNKKVLKYIISFVMNSINNKKDISNTVIDFIIDNDIIEEYSKYFYNIDSEKSFRALKKYPLLYNKISNKTIEMVEFIIEYKKQNKQIDTCDNNKIILKQSISNIETAKYFIEKDIKYIKYINSEIFLDISNEFIN